MDGLLARRDAAHAYAVMRGLTTANGAMVAAATMSLPERAEAGRNYDYRHAWIRDQCFAGQAAASIAAVAARRRSETEARAELPLPEVQETEEVVSDLVDVDVVKAGVQFRAGVADPGRG